MFESIALMGDLHEDKGGIVEVLRWCSAYLIDSLTPVHSLNHSHTTLGEGTRLIRTNIGCIAHCFTRLDEQDSTVKFQETLETHSAPEALG